MVTVLVVAVEEVDRPWILDSTFLIHPGCNCLQKKVFTVKHKHPAYVRYMHTENAYCANVGLVRLTPNCRGGVATACFSKGGSNNLG